MADSIPDSVDAVERAPRGFLARSAHALREELAVDPRKVAVGLVSRALPQFAFVRVRTLALRAAGIRIGARSAVQGELQLTGAGDPRALFSIGEDTVISGPLYVDLGARVTIGDWVQIGHHVTLLTVNHEIGPADARCGRTFYAPITIGNGAWLASNVTVLPGVTIGDGAVVAAGAVVARDVPPDTLVGGIPARTVRKLGHDAERRSWHPPARQGGGE